VSSYELVSPKTLLRDSCAIDLSGSHLFFLLRVGVFGRNCECWAAEGGGAPRWGIVIETASQMRLMGSAVEKTHALKDG